MADQTADFKYNFELLAHSDVGGYGDTVQVMMSQRHLYMGHHFTGRVSIVDVKDPRKPKYVDSIIAPPNTASLHCQTADNLLLAVNAVMTLGAVDSEEEYYTKSLGDTFKPKGEFAAGLRIWDIEDPASPREIGFMPVEGLGLHRIWYTGGQYAYVSAQIRGFVDYIFLVVDVSDPTKPHEVGRWWLPGMWREGGEEPGWPEGKRYSLHHAIIAGDTAYGSWRDGGLTLLDIADRANPSLISHVNWCPPFGGGTHNAVPLLDRDLLIVVDESVLDDCKDQVKYIWVVDIREPSNPVTVSTFPTPSEEDYCSKGAHFGPHNIHEMRPGSFQSSELIFATYQNAGLRAFDISNHYRPEEVGAFVPPAPAKMIDPRPGRPQVIQSCDVYVDTDRICYMSDNNAGLHVVQYTGE